MRPASVSGRRLLQPRGVDQRDPPAAQQRLGLLAVAGHARGVGDQRAPPAGQAIEQRGLADIRAPGDDDDREHPAAQRKATRLASSVMTNTVPPATDGATDIAPGSFCWPRIWPV